jgi:hypothetical protein
VRSETAQTSPRRAGSPPAPTPVRCRARAPTRQVRRSPWRQPGTVCSPISSPVAAETAAIVCERLWVSAPSTIIDLVHLHLGFSGPPADTACWGRCHAPIKSRRTSPTGDERHSERWSGPNGRQPERESARRRSRSLHLASDVTDAPNPNSKPGRSVRAGPQVCSSYLWRLLQKPPWDPERRSVMGRPMLGVAESRRRMGRGPRPNCELRYLSHHSGS